VQRGYAGIVVFYDGECVSAALSGGYLNFSPQRRTTAGTHDYMDAGVVTQTVRDRQCMEQLPKAQKTLFVRSHKTTL
jgi:hypothetical protein